MQDFRKLEVWKLSVELVKEIYLLTNKYPDEEKYGLTSQIRRSAVSIPSNIAEGTGRRTQKDFIYFIHNSIGSLSELESHLEVSIKLGFLTREDTKEMLNEIDKIRRKCINFIKSINNSIKS